MLAWLIPTVWAPTVVALMLTWWSDGTKGVTRVLRRVRPPRNAGWPLAVAAIFPAAGVALAIAAGRAAGDAAPFIPTAAVPFVILLQLLTGAVGEELGWRGFLLPRLAERLGKLGAGWTMAILWSLWHIAAFYFPGTPHQMMPPLPNLLFTLFFGVFLAFVFTRTGGSVFATMVAHLSINVATGMGGVLLSSDTLWWVLVAIFGTYTLWTTVTLPTQAHGGAR